MGEANRNPIWAIKLVAAVLIVSAAGSYSPAHAEDCAAADAIAAQHQGKPYREDLLRRMIELCPGHAGALNNLAVILESNDRLEEAEHLYRRAIRAGNAIAPYAGLGDVLAARGDARGAVAAYELFLAGLPAEIRRGDPSGLADYESEYRARLALAMETAGIDPASRPAPADPVRSGKFVTAEQIARSLTTKPRRTRGLSLSRRTEPFVDIQIQFDFDSARIRPDSLAQHQDHRLTRRRSCRPVGRTFSRRSFPVACLSVRSGNERMHRLGGGLGALPYPAARTTTTRWRDAVIYQIAFLRRVRI